MNREHDRLLRQRQMTTGDRPLSFNQSTLLVVEWLRHLRREPIAPRPVKIAQYLEGDVDADVLQAALDAVVERHEVLRTAFPDPRRLTRTQEQSIFATLARDDLSGGPAFVQRVVPHARLMLEVEPAAEDEEGAPALRRRVRELIEAPFDYDAPPLVRAVLFVLAPRRYLLLLVLHHLVADAWSLGLCTSEIDHAYAARLRGAGARALPPVQLQYGDFAAAQQRRFAGSVLGDAIRYWRDQWLAFGACMLKPSDLPLAAAADAASEPRWASVAIDADSGAAMRRLAHEHRASVYMVCVAAMAVVCHAYTGRRRLAWWGYSANRGSTEAEGAIGWFAHGRILGLDVAPDDDVPALLARVRALLSAIAAYEEVPLQLAWRAIDHERAAQADADDFLAFSLLPHRATVGRLGDSVITRTAPFELTVTDTSKSLTVWAFEADGAPTGIACGYCTAWFDPIKVAAFLGAFGRVLSRVAANPSTPVAALASECEAVV